MNAVFSFSTFVYKTKSKEDFAGFISQKMFLNSCVMSIMQAKKFFNKVILVTDELGYEIFKPLKLPIDIIHKDLDEKMVENHFNFWAISKIFAHLYQKEPFVHLDLDLYLWKDIPSILKNRDIICYYREVDQTKLYSDQIDSFKKYGSKNILPNLTEYIYSNPRADIAYNTAVFGGNDLNFIKRYSNDILTYLEKCDYKETDKIFYRSCTFFEQYYLTIKAHQENVKIYSYSDIIGPFLHLLDEYSCHFIWKQKMKRENEELLQIWINQKYSEFNKNVLNAEKELNLLIK